MARMGPRVRCSSPHPTTYSTAWQTLSQELRKDCAVSFHDSFLAQWAKNSMWALVSWCLPIAHGSSSTRPPQSRQSTRRIRLRIPGQKLFVDYAGRTAEVIDPLTRCQYASKSDPLFASNCDPPSVFR